MPATETTKRVEPQPIEYLGYELRPANDIARCYGGWRWEFTHPDYDGPEDNRCGGAKTLQECLEQIDEIEDARESRREQREIKAKSLVAIATDFAETVHRFAPKAEPCECFAALRRLGISHTGALKCDIHDPSSPFVAPKAECAVCGATAGPVTLFRRAAGPWACPSHVRELYGDPSTWPHICKDCGAAFTNHGEIRDHGRVCDSCAGES